MTQLSIRQAFLATAIFAVGTMEFPLVVTKQWSFAVHRERTGQGRTTADPCQRRRRCTANDTPRSRRRRGRGRSCCKYSLRPRARKWSLCLPLNGNVARSAVLVSWRDDAVRTAVAARVAVAACWTGWDDVQTGPGGLVWTSCSVRCMT